MRLIERYIFAKAAIAALMVLGALVGVVWVVQALREIDIIASNGQSIWTFLSITMLVVPNLAQAIVPLALLIATVHAINTMNANSELVVVSASGCSNWTIAKPLLVLALLCSLFTGLVAHVVSPYSLQRVKVLVTEMKADLVSVVLQEGTFNTIEDGLTFHVGERGAAGLLSNILISDDREKNVSAVYSAKEGIVTRTAYGSFLILKDGEIQQTDHEEESVTLIKYQSYAFDLSSFSGKSEIPKTRIKERPTWELLTPDASDKDYQDNPGRFRQQIHERFSEMLWPFANVLMILAFSGQARSSRQSFSSSIATAVAILIVARGFGFSAVSSLKTDPSAILFTYGVPLSCIAFGLYCVVSNKPAQLPKQLSQQLDRINGRILAYFEQLALAYKLYRRRRAGIST